VSSALMLNVIKEDSHFNLWTRYYIPYLFNYIIYMVGSDQRLKFRFSLTFPRCAKLFASTLKFYFPVGMAFFLIWFFRFPEVSEQRNQSTTNNPCSKTELKVPCLCPALIWSVFFDKIGWWYFACLNKSRWSG